jgi:hypothetical protein
MRLGHWLEDKLVDDGVKYASETWILTRRERKQINIFERKVCRRNLGTVYDSEKEN